MKGENERDTRESDAEAVSQEARQKLRQNEEIQGQRCEPKL